MLSSSWKSLREACAVNNGWKSPGLAPPTSLLTLLFGIYCWGETNVKSLAVPLLQTQPFRGGDRHGFSLQAAALIVEVVFLSSQRDSISCNLFPFARYNCILPHLAWGFYLLSSVPYFRLRLSSSLFHRTQSRSIMTANLAGQAARRQLCAFEACGTGARSKTYVSLKDRLSGEGQGLRFFLHSIRRGIPL